MLGSRDKYGGYSYYCWSDWPTFKHKLCWGKAKSNFKGNNGGKTIKTKTNKEKTIAFPVYATGLKKSSDKAEWKQ